MSFNRAPARSKHLKDEVDIFYSSMQNERELHQRRRAQQNIYRPGVPTVTSSNLNTAGSSSSGRLGTSYMAQSGAAVGYMEGDDDDDFVFDAQLVTPGETNMSDDMEMETLDLHSLLASSNSRSVKRAAPSSNDYYAPPSSTLVGISTLDDMGDEDEDSIDDSRAVSSRQSSVDVQKPLSRAELLAQAKARAQTQVQVQAQEQAQTESNEAQKQTLGDLNLPPTDTKHRSFAEHGMNGEPSMSFTLSTTSSSVTASHPVSTPIAPASLNSNDMNLFVSEYDVLEFKSKAQRKHRFMTTEAEKEEEEQRRVNQRAAERAERRQQIRAEVVSHLETEAELEALRREEEVNDSDNLPDDCDLSEEEEQDILAWKLRELERLSRVAEAQKKEEEEISQKEYLRNLTPDQLRDEFSLMKEERMEMMRTSKDPFYVRLREKMEGEKPVGKTSRGAFFIDEQGNRDDLFTRDMGGRNSKLSVEKESDQYVPDFVKDPKFGLRGRAKQVDPATRDTSKLVSEHSEVRTAFAQLSRLGTGRKR